MTPATSQPDLQVQAPAEPETPRLDHAGLYPLLKQVPILVSLQEDDLDCLDGIQQVHRSAGDIIERQGEVGRFFWILLTGKLRVFTTRPDKIEVTMGTLASGSAFGELPLLGNIQNPSSFQALEPCLLLRFTDEEFWQLMTSCTEVRKAILGNPGAAARRAATQLRENLLRLHELSARFTRNDLTTPQKECLLDLQSHVLSAPPLQLNSLEQSDAEEALAEWMESANIENAWKIAPTLVTVGIDARELGCARESFDGTIFSDALNWLDALVSSMQLVGTIEESIGRVSTLVMAVKSYAYEGKGQRQTVNVNESLHATLVILGHKMREKQITVEKSLDAGLPPLESFCSMRCRSTGIFASAPGLSPIRRPMCRFSALRSKTMGRGFRSRCSRTSSIPFIRPSRWGLGRGLGLGSLIRSSSSTGAQFGSPRHREVRSSGFVCLRGKLLHLQ
jgi:CRP-like cAMP-binding protein